MYFLLNMGILQCHVSFQGCKCFGVSLVESVPFKDHEVDAIEIWILQGAEKNVKQNPVIKTKRFCYIYPYC